MELFDTTILNATYHKVDLDKVINNEKHLTEKQQKELHEVLTKFTKLFYGTLGVYKHRKLHMELLTDSVAKHSRPYSVP